MKLKLGDRCSYNPTKIPLIWITFSDFKCNVAYSGKCTIPGLKTLESIHIKQQSVVNEFLNLCSKEVIKNYINGIYNININNDNYNQNNNNYKYTEEYEKAEKDKLHFIKTESFFMYVNKNKKGEFIRTKPIKYFNMSDFQKPKKKFEDRINSITNKKHDVSLNQCCEFYLKNIMNDEYKK